MSADFNTSSETQIIRLLHTLHLTNAVASSVRFTLDLLYKCSLQRTSKQTLQHTSKKTLQHANKQTASIVQFCTSCESDKDIGEFSRSQLKKAKAGGKASCRGCIKAAETKCWKRKQAIRTSKTKILLKRANADLSLKKKNREMESVPRPNPTHMHETRSMTPATFAAKDTAGWRKALIDDGYAVIRNFLPAKRRSELIEQFWIDLKICKPTICRDGQ